VAQVHTWLLEHVQPPLPQSLAAVSGQHASPSPRQWPSAQVWPLAHPHWLLTQLQLPLPQSAATQQSVLRTGRQVPSGQPTPSLQTQSWLASQVHELSTQSRSSQHSPSLRQ
jgi:hypothetical protein